MCTTANVSLIEQAIDEKVVNGEMFSAYDITRIAKSKGANENHYQMKNTVHKLYGDLQTRGYTRTLIPTPTGDTFLYHKAGDDIQPYIDRINPNGTPTGNALPSPNVAAAPAQPSLSATATATATGGSQRTQEVDAEGRLPIYPDMLDCIKAKPGDDIFVYDDGSELYVSRKKLASSQPLADKYTVNADGRVRISATLLSGSYGSQKQFTIKHNTTGNVLTID